MSKTIAPLLSFSAGGQIGRTAVYATWKGIPYVRRYTVPANPRTTRQQVTRNIFRNLQHMWLISPGGLKAPFLANASGRPYTGNNKFTSINLEGVDTVVPPTDFLFFQASPGAKGGLPPAGLVAVGGALSIAATVTAPQVPDDWTIAAAQGVAFPDADPQVPFVGNIQFVEDNADPFVLNFVGLEAATDYIVSAWFQWNRPDGTLAYSTSLTVLEATT